MESGPSDRLVVDLVRRYGDRVRAAALEQCPEDLVYSPLGIWLLLCACAPLTSGTDRAALEEIVGCPAEDALRALGSLLRHLPPAAVRAGAALWIRDGIDTSRLRSWQSRLPQEFEHGPMPSQKDADAWVSDRTGGLINGFPGEVGILMLALVSVLVTDVRWPTPYGVVASRDHFPRTSPWHGAVARVLRSRDRRATSLVDTGAAGLVAVHQAAAPDHGITVICVSAAPEVRRERVLAAATEVAQHLADGSPLPATSLFDLPLGDGHSWTISEEEIPDHQPGRSEWVRETVLPAWNIESRLALLASPAFGAALATSALGQLVPVDLPAAAQSAMASFHREGFKAAAVTSFAMRMSLPSSILVLRTASVCFDHPFAALAMIHGGGPEPQRFYGLPLFEAWIHTPAEVPPDSGKAAPERAEPPRRERAPTPPRRYIRATHRPPPGR